MRLVLLYSVFDNWEALALTAVELLCSHAHFSPPSLAGGEGDFTGRFSIVQPLISHGMNFKLLKGTRFVCMLMHMC